MKPSLRKVYRWPHEWTPPKFQVQPTTPPDPFVCSIPKLQEQILRSKTYNLKFPCRLAWLPSSQVMLPDSGGMFLAIEHVDARGTFTYIRMDEVERQLRAKGYVDWKTPKP